jgi:hypothetical protein
MTTTPMSLQDLRRKIYVKAKAEKAHRFWGLYVHVCKRETLREAYRMAKKNNGLSRTSVNEVGRIENGEVVRARRGSWERASHFRFRISL